jgi:hypothetical protein
VASLTGRRAASDTAIGDLIIPPGSAGFQRPIPLERTLTLYNEGAWCATGCDLPPPPTQSPVSDAAAHSHAAAARPAVIRKLSAQMEILKNVAEGIDPGYSFVSLYTMSARATDS